MPKPNKIQLLVNKPDILITIGFFAFALAIRVTNLGLFLTADEPRAWFGWTINFAQAIMEGRGGETFFNYTPGVTLMWLGSFGLYLDYLFNPGPSTNFTEFLYALPFDPIDPNSIFWFRLPGVIIGSACIAVSYKLIKQLLGTKIALVGALLLALDPLHIGMTRVFGNDGLAASLMLVSTLAVILFFLDAEKAYKKLFISAVFAGLAILAKSTAVYLFPMVGLVIIVTVFYYKQPKQIGLYIRDGLLWGTVVFLTIVVLWPALWFQPIETIQSVLTRLGGAVDEPHNRGSFFMGQPVPDPGIWFYWVISFFRLTFVTTIGLIFAAIYLFLKNRAKSDFNINHQKIVIFLLWAFIIFYLIFLSLGSKKQDRYMVPITPMVTFLAAAGYVWLVKKLPNFNQTLILGAIISLQAAVAWYSAPYYLSHYNLLAGGGKVAANTLLVGWGEGLDLAANYLNSLPESETLKVSSWYHSTFEPYFKGHALEDTGNEKISRSAKPGLASNYVVLYVNQIQRQMPTPGFIQYYQSFEPEYVVAINGIDYAFIYSSPAVAHPLSGQVRLVGQAELLGYNLLDKQEQPISNLSADSTAIIQLYWEWQGKAPDEPISLNLVDRDGRVWGQGIALGSFSPLVFEDWAEGAIARDDFTLTILPGTPPGDYYLKAWIDRPATGERVGDFPLLLEDTHIVVARPASPPPLSDLSLSEHLNLSLVEGAITLLGLDNSEQMIQPWQPDESRELLLYWQASRSIDKNYPVTLALVDTNGIIRAGWSNLPAGGYFPTNHWQSGDIIRDPWTLTLPPYVPPGDYRLTVSLGKESPMDLLTIPVEGRPRLFEPPPLDMALNTPFGQTIELLGLQTPTANPLTIELTPGQPVSLNLVWQATHLVDADYTVTVQLLDGQQQVYAQRDSMPLDGNAPTTSWAIGEVLVDAITLDIPSEAGPGPHHLLLALYRFETGERLPLPNGSDHLEIPVKIQMQ